MSDIFSSMLGLAPETASVTVGNPLVSAGTAAPPQSTRCSRDRISALPEFGPNFLERNEHEAAHGGRRKLLFPNGFAEPLAGELLDDSRRLSAVLIEVSPELRVISDSVKAGAGAYVVR